MNQVSKLLPSNCNEEHQNMTCNMRTRSLDDHLGYLNHTPKTVYLIYYNAVTKIETAKLRLEVLCICTYENTCQKTALFGAQVQTRNHGYVWMARKFMDTSFYNSRLIHRHNVIKFNNMMLQTKKTLNLVSMLSLTGVWIVAKSGYW